MAQLERRAAAASSAVLHGDEAALDDARALLQDAPFLFHHIFMQWATPEAKYIPGARMLLQSVPGPAQFRLVVVHLAPEEMLQLLHPDELSWAHRVQLFAVALESPQPITWVNEGCFMLELGAEPEVNESTVPVLVKRLRPYTAQSDVVVALLKTLERSTTTSATAAQPAPATTISLPAHLFHVFMQPSSGIHPLHVSKLTALLAGPSVVPSFVLLGWEMDVFCCGHRENINLGHGAALIRVVALHLNLSFEALLGAFYSAATLHAASTDLGRLLSGSRRWVHDVLETFVSKSSPARLMPTMELLALTYRAWGIEALLGDAYDAFLTTDGDGSVWWTRTCAIAAAIPAIANPDVHATITDYVAAVGASVVLSCGMSITGGRLTQTLGSGDDEAMASIPRWPAALWPHVLALCLENGPVDWIAHITMSDADCTAVVTHWVANDRPSIALAFATALATRVSYHRGRRLLLSVVAMSPHVLHDVLAIPSLPIPQRTLVADVLSNVESSEVVEAWRRRYADAWATHSDALARMFLTQLREAQDDEAFALWTRCCADDAHFLDTLFYSLVRAHPSVDRTRLWNAIVRWLREAQSPHAAAWAAHLAPIPTPLAAYVALYTRRSVDPRQPTSPLRLETHVRQYVDGSAPADVGALVRLLMETALQSHDERHAEDIALTLHRFGAYWVENDFEASIADALCRPTRALVLPRLVHVARDGPWPRLCQRPDVLAAFLSLLLEAPSVATTLQTLWNRPAFDNQLAVAAIVQAAVRSSFLSPRNAETWATYCSQRWVTITLPASQPRPGHGLLVLRGTEVLRYTHNAGRWRQEIVGASPAAVEAPVVLMDCASWIEVVGHCADARLADSVRATLVEVYLPLECRGDGEVLGQAVLAGAVRLALAAHELSPWLVSATRALCPPPTLNVVSWVLRSLKRIATATAAPSPVALADAIHDALDALRLVDVIRAVLATQAGATQWLLVELRQAFLAHPAFRTGRLGGLLVVYLVVVYCTHVPDGTSVFQKSVCGLLQRHADLLELVRSPYFDALVNRHCPLHTAKAAPFVAFLRALVPATDTADAPASKRPRTDAPLGIVWSALLTDESWSKALGQELQRPHMRRLAAFLDLETRLGRVVCPAQADLFAAFNRCSLDTIRVVLLGSEPYASLEQATGLCFSLPFDAAPSQSLTRILDEVAADVGVAVPPTQRSLEAWCRQGVLLLNSVLSVRQGSPQSHRCQGWEAFVDSVIRTINRTASHVVFLLWETTLPKQDVLINGAKHLVLTGGPGSRCFTASNRYLQQHGRPTINWAAFQ
ncbi:uracil-DNA glycosylase [Achlya hypogyna]|uniref:Uracil-DNA glycosylase n=1 Tax=Achlya hypogyna TaxID=1202772 RepID=A0A1V9Z054_ACHHY|nr:uracil-DNA glycosylase [Achlya hypogyna]